MEQYCLYLRKSRADEEAEARGEEDVLARHEHTLLDLARRYNLPITHIYREVVSGETITARPEMQKLLSQVEQGHWTGVLVMEVERLARGDTIDQGLVSRAFKFSNTRIITPMKTYDPNNEFDEEYFEFGLFMSRREYKTITRRLQRGRLASVEEGKFAGSVAPYGYNRKKLEKEKGWTLEIDPEQAEVVRMIFTFYTQDRMGVSLICGKLNELKISPSKGGEWVPATILDMLRNPVYMGKIRWHWRKTVKKIEDGNVKRSRPRSEDGDWILVDGLHEAIISEEMWQLAQDYLALNEPRLTSSRDQVKNPLCSLIICGECGRRMVRKPHKKAADEIRCPLTGCKTVSSKLEIIEVKLLDSLRDWLQKYKVEWELDKPALDDSLLEAKRNALEKTEKELIDLQKQLGNIHDLLEQGIYTTDVFLERSKLISSKITQANEYKVKVSAEVVREEEKNKKLKTLIPKIERVLELYSQAEDPEQKNELLKSVLEKVVYFREKGGRWVDPEEFELVLYPILPK